MDRARVDMVAPLACADGTSVSPRRRSRRNGRIPSTKKGCRHRAAAPWRAACAGSSTCGWRLGGQRPRRSRRRSDGADEALGQRPDPVLVVIMEVMWLIDARAGSAAQHCAGRHHPSIGPQAVQVQRLGDRQLRDAQRIGRAAHAAASHDFEEGTEVGEGRSSGELNQRRRHYRERRGRLRLLLGASSYAPRVFISARAAQVQPVDAPVPRVSCDEHRQRRGVAALPRAMWHLDAVHPQQPEIEQDADIAAVRSRGQGRDAVVQPVGAPPCVTGPRSGPGRTFRRLQLAGSAWICR